MFLRQPSILASRLNNSPLVSSFTSLQTRSISKHLKAFATIDPENLSTSDKGFDLVNATKYTELINPLNGVKMIIIPDTSGGTPLARDAY